jgi:hypothetical protein
MGVRNYGDNLSAVLRAKHVNLPLHSFPHPGYASTAKRLVK